MRGGNPLFRGVPPPLSRSPGYMNVLKNSRVAILTIDPGETTGVAYGIVDLRYGTAMDALRNVEHLMTKEVSGGFFEQAMELAGIMEKFCKWGLSRADQVYIVFEDFILRRLQYGGATGNLTSVWVMAGAIGAFGDDTIVSYQQPSEAKTYATNERLQLWGLYERGSGEHTRDATRHFALKVNKLLG